MSPSKRRRQRLIKNGAGHRLLTLRLAESQNWRCCYCGCCIREGATLDHLQTVGQGGKSTYDNCVAACWPCNNRRGNMNPKKFFNLVRRGVFKSIMGRAAA